MQTNSINQSIPLPTCSITTATLSLLVSLLTGSLLTTNQLVFLLIPLPHFGVSQVLLVLPLPGAV